MKNEFINLFNELPYLIVLTACYIIMDRYGFKGTLGNIIYEGWKKRLQKFGGHLRRGGKLLPLQPADHRKILKKVGFDMGLKGHQREVTEKLADKEEQKDTFASDSSPDSTPSVKKSAVVSADEYDEVFSDNRYADADEEFEGDVPPPEDLATEETYTDDSYYEDNTRGGYKELETALNLVTGKPMTKEETELAKRAVINMRGTTEYLELEQKSEHIRDKIRSVVADVLGNAAEATETEHHSNQAFDWSGYK